MRSVIKSGAFVNASLTGLLLKQVVPSRENESAGVEQAFCFLVTEKRYQVSSFSSQFSDRVASM